MNNLPPALGAGKDGAKDLPPSDSRVIIDTSSFKAEDDFVLDVAGKRMGERLSDATILTDNGFGSALNEMGRALVGRSGPSMMDSLKKVLGDAGTALPDWESALKPLGDGDRRILKIQLDAPIPKEHYVYYFFSQRSHPAVSLFRRIYEDEAYRKLHARFVATDLETLVKLPKNIISCLEKSEAECAAFGLGWSSSLALGVEVGARQIIDSGGVSEAASIWNEDTEKFLGLVWDYIEVGYRILSGNGNMDALDNSYRSLMTYLDAVNPA